MNFNMNFLIMLTFICGFTGERISIQVFRSLKKEAKQKNKMAHDSNPLEKKAGILGIARSMLYLISD